MAEKTYHLFLLIMLAMLVATKAKDVRPSDMSVFQGETAFFNCTADEVRWMRANQSIDGQFVEIFSSSTGWNRDSTKYEIVGKYNLVIKDARINSDGGKYGCLANRMIHDTYLTVIDDMSLNVEPDGYLRRGMTIFINCSVRFGGPRNHVPALKLTLDGEPAFPQGQGYYQAPHGNNNNIHRWSMIVNYTLSEETPGRYLRCEIKSHEYVAEITEMLRIKFAPSIAEPVVTPNVVPNYNTTDNITCLVDGIPEPLVTWTRIAGNMRDRTVSGRRQAVLEDLEVGTHTWMCSAENELGSANVTITFTVSDVGYPEPSTGANKVGIGIGIGLGIGIPIIIAIIVIVCLLMRRRKDKQPKSGGGAQNNKPTDPGKPPINNDHRPPRPTSDGANDPNVNPNPAPYTTPVYPEQYSSSPPKTNTDKPGFGDLGVRPIHAGGSTPSLNRSYESSQRESGTDDRFQGPNTSV